MTAAPAKSLTTMVSRLGAIALALLLGACATEQKALSSAASAPLEDLNLVGTPVPEVLNAALQSPYALPADGSCPALVAELKSLDEALGPAVGGSPLDSDPDLIDRGGAAVGSAAAGALRRTAEGVIPFRSWVRKLSGAEHRSQQLAAAIAAGTLRRAFLRGLATGRGCE